MREYSVPIPEDANFQRGTADYAFDSAAVRPNHVALRRRRGTEWVDVTTTQFVAEVTALAKGLIGAGVNAGDRVALMSRTVYEWTVTDFAIFAIGAVTVPIYETSSAEQVQWILSDSGAVACFVETEAHAATVESVRSGCHGLGPVWVFESGGVATAVALGADRSDDEVQARRAAVKGSDLASLIYTSGTTGRPKGCELTHSNFVAEVDVVAGGLAGLFNPQASTLLFIPIAHVFGRVIQIGAIATGTTLGHAPDVAELVVELGSFRPTFVLSVPRVFEKVYNTAKQKAHADGKGKIFDQAAAVAIAYSEALDTGSVPFVLKLRHKVFDKLVYSKLRAALGGKCEAAISGGAPLGPRLGHFYRGIGVTIYEGYGLTESTAGVCVNLTDAVKIGTVGRPVPGMSMRIADDGELLMKGVVIFRGYWNNPEATREAIDGDGWFHTGDLGEIDDEGFLKITGRKKELIVTAAGKNVAPAVLEDRLRANWLISQCLVVGDQQPFIAALITIDPDVFPVWLSRNDLPVDTKLSAVIDNEALRNEIQAAVDDANKAVSKAESIRKFAILPDDWTEAGGQITPSLKLKRNIVMKENAAQIESLYVGVQHV
ncbi:MAG: Long-chain-fatty-acid--CoA ligase [Pseudonocardiales bacterium]|nr:Long-chain-fatty-acid--CoA ligase [Pseudonocardiales bacterium]